MGGGSKDWRDLFDLIVYRSDKPQFFSSTDAKMYQLDFNSPTLQGKTVRNSCFQTKENFQGNFQVL